MDDKQADDRTRLENIVPNTLEFAASGVNSSVLGCDCRTHAHNRLQPNIIWHSDDEETFILSSKKAPFRHITYCLFCLNASKRKPHYLIICNACR